MDCNCCSCRGFNSKQRDDKYNDYGCNFDKRGFVSITYEPYKDTYVYFSGDDEYEYPLHGPINIRRYFEFYGNGHINMEHILKTGDPDTLKRYLLNGYEIHTGCSCCAFDYHDIIKTVSNIEMFKVFVNNICGSELIRARQEIERLITESDLLSIINDRIKNCNCIFSNHVESSMFDETECKELLQLKQKENIFLHVLFPTDMNEVLYEGLLRNNNIDINGALKCILINFKFGKYLKTSMRLAKVCIDLGANTDIIKKEEYDDVYNRRLDVLLKYIPKSSVLKGI